MRKLTDYQSFLIEAELEKFEMCQNIRSLDVEIQDTELDQYPQMWTYMDGKYYVQFDIARTPKGLEISVTDEDCKTTYFEF